MATILPKVIVEILAAIAAAIVSVGVPLLIAKFNKLKKTHTAVFGIKGVEEVGGLSEAISEHADTISELKSDQKRIINTLENIDSRVDDVAQSQREMQDFINYMKYKEQEVHGNQYDSD